MMTSIGLSGEAKHKLRQLKIHKESYEDVINRICPKTLHITLIDGKEVNCYFYGFFSPEGKPSLNIYSPETESNRIIPLEIIKSIEVQDE